jgi:dynein heavy chain
MNMKEYLINTLIRMNETTDNTLFSVLFTHYFLSCLQNVLIPDMHRDNVVSIIVMVHQSVTEYSKEFLMKLRRSNYVTPKNYLDFINTYLKLLDEKDQWVLSQCDRLVGGLQKLAEASEQLNELNKKLAVQKIAVTEKTEACESLLADITSGTEQATDKKQMAEAKGQEIEEQSKIISVEKVRKSASGPAMIRNSNLV